LLKHRQFATRTHCRIRRMVFSSRVPSLIWICTVQLLQWVHAARLEERAAKLQVEMSDRIMQIADGRINKSRTGWDYKDHTRMNDTAGWEAVIKHSPYVTRLTGDFEGRDGDIIKQEMKAMITSHKDLCKPQLLLKPPEYPDCHGEVLVATLTPEPFGRQALDVNQGICWSHAKPAQPKDVKALKTVDNAKLQQCVYQPYKLLLQSQQFLLGSPSMNGTIYAIWKKSKYHEGVILKDTLKEIDGGKTCGVYSFLSSFFDDFQQPIREGEPKAQGVLCWPTALMDERQFLVYGPRTHF